MAPHRKLDGIGDDFAGDERGLHALMTHRDAVRDRDGAKFAGRTSGFLDTFFGGLRLTHQRDVAGRGFIPAGHDAHERLMNLALRQAHRVVIRAVRRAFRPFCHVARGEFRFVEGRHLDLVGSLSPTYWRVSHYARCAMASLSRAATSPASLRFSRCSDSTSSGAFATNCWFDNLPSTRAISSSAFFNSRSRRARSLPKSI